MSGSKWNKMCKQNEANFQNIMYLFIYLLHCNISMWMTQYFCIKYFTFAYLIMHTFLHYHFCYIFLIITMALKYITKMIKNKICFISWHDNNPPPPHKKKSLKNANNIQNTFFFLFDLRVNYILHMFWKFGDSHTRWYVQVSLKIPAVCCNLRETGLLVYNSVGSQQRFTQGISKALSMISFQRISL